MHVFELKRRPPEYFYCAKCDAESGNETSEDDVVDAEFEEVDDEEKDDKE